MDPKKQVEALDMARKRFEDQLIKDQIKEQLDQEDLKQAINESVKYYEELDKQKRRHMEDNRRILERQMEEEKMRKHVEKIDRQTNDIACYGPIETEEIAKLLKDKKLVDQQQMNRVLMDQINERDLQKKEEKA